jgi:hypothetical protein
MVAVWVGFSKVEVRMAVAESFWRTGGGNAGAIEIGKICRYSQVCPNLEIMGRQSLAITGTCCKHNWDNRGADPTNREQNIHMAPESAVKVP